MELVPPGPRPRRFQPRGGTCLYVSTFYAHRARARCRCGRISRDDGVAHQRGMIRSVREFTARSFVSGALVVGCAAMGVAGCGAAGSSVTKTAARDFAQDVNLRTRDVPGAHVSPGSRGSSEEPFALARCSGRGKPSGLPVAREVSPSISAPHAFIASAVVVERSAAAAAAELAPFASASGRACLIRGLGAAVTSQGQTTETSFAVGGKSVLVPTALGPGAAALHVLAELSHAEPSKGIDAETQKLLRRLELTPAGKRRAERERRLLERHLGEKVPPFHVSFAMFRVGPADIALFSIGGPISPALERRLLLLLHSRAVTHKL